MLQNFRKFLAEKGQGIVEYAMVLGFVAILAVGLWNSSLFDQSKGLFNQVSTQFSKVNESVKNTSVPNPK